ncbi:hypothetical protein RclHR1_01150007 [Rhizophagus clarus]|uniref:F-box domain-containing protein n=1 Tax=Rhizophagus clarus TaxID=94130 RepID=A0A2Z6Q461_9GLOM|nr:hypothetical protein RclHR1_01150007 [Rhizophagus clarus]GES99122.1 hypothetical protein GLOIN_2v1884114 [Rhizophagus clarus]
MSLHILPADIIFEIIRNLRYNRKTLLQFLLTNKFFSKIVVSILWENPFKTCKTENSNKLIKFYVQTSNEEEINEIKKLFNREIESKKSKNGGKPLFFQYGSYLKEFQLEKIIKAIITWTEDFRNRRRHYYSEDETKKALICIMKLIMKQCQSLDLLEWNISFNNDSLLEIMQYKIKDLKELIINCYDNKSGFGDNYIKYFKERDNNIECFEYFKNYSKNISKLSIYYKNTWPDKNIKGFISFIESQNDLSNFIFDNENNNDEFKDLITSTLESSTNNLTKMMLNNVNFSNLSFDYIDKCINLEMLVLRHNKELKFDDMDLYSNFKNLKKLDLSYNDWSTEVTNLIIKKAGNGLFSLVIGEGDTEQAIINDGTLITLTKSCPNIKSLSFSKISNEKIDMIFSYLGDFKLVTLQISQAEAKGTIMNSKLLLNHINDGSFCILDLGKNDTYWSHYNDKRRNFDRLLREHNIILAAYKPKVIKM